MAQTLGGQFDLHARLIWEHAIDAIDDLRERTQSVFETQYELLPFRPIDFFERLNGTFDTYNVSKPSHLSNAKSSVPGKVSAARATIRDLKSNSSLQGKNATGKKQLPAVLAFLWDYHPETAREFYKYVADQMPDQYADTFRRFANASVHEVGAAPTTEDDNDSAKKEHLEKDAKQNAKRFSRPWGLLGIIILLIMIVVMLWLASGRFAGGERPSSDTSGNDPKDDDASMVRTSNTSGGPPDSYEDYPKVDNIRNSALGSNSEEPEDEIVPDTILAGMIISESSLFRQIEQSVSVNLLEESGYASISDFSFASTDEIVIEGAALSKSPPSYGNELSLIKIANRITGIRDGETVFDMSISPSGELNFVLLRALDHDQNSDEISILVPILATNSRSGDPLQAMVRIVVLDDAPNVIGTFCALYESLLKTSSEVKVSGGFKSNVDTPFNFGADGPGILRLTGTFWAEETFAGRRVLLSSNGEPVNVAIKDHRALGKVRGRTAFSFVLNGRSGEYTYRQFLPLDQIRTEDDLKVILNFEAEARDRDGDASIASIQIDVYEDCERDCR